MPGCARTCTFVLTIIGFVAAQLAGCSREPAKPEPADGPDILLIVVDTLRSDKLGCYGSNLGATPRIDALAADGVRFERAYAHSPWTLPSLASMLTSLDPLHHGAGGQAGKFTRLRPWVRTLAECFRDEGYATASVVNVEFLTGPFGLTRGFDHVDFEVYPSNVQMRSAGRTTNAALAWLRAPRDRPFFLLVHYFDPHLVYAPPQPFRDKFADPRDRRDSSWVFGTRRQIGGYRQGKTTFTRASIKRAEKLYDGEVAYTDSEVGRLLTGLRTMGLADSTVVVLTADHGEEFLDHDGFEHGHTLYDELVRVPLIIRFPGRFDAGTIEATVAHVDLAPTLCDLAGISTDPGFAGRTLVELMDGGEVAQRPIAFEGNHWGPPHRGWLQDGHKLVLPADGGALLFDLRNDPFERNDLSRADPQRVARMTRDLETARQSMGADPRHEPVPVELTPEELDRLRSLGYVP
ncbi:MAG: sulfatase [Phycisphaerales bacterium]|nr:MAG: sulfatase [Phycisphaerales bacterium]